MGQEWLSLLVTRPTLNHARPVFVHGKTFHPKPYVLTHKNFDGRISVGPGNDCLSPRWRTSQTSRVP